MSSFSASSRFSPYVLFLLRVGSTPDLYPWTDDVLVFIPHLHVVHIQAIRIIAAAFPSHVSHPLRGYGRGGPVQHVSSVRGSFQGRARRFRSGAGAALIESGFHGSHVPGDDNGPLRDGPPAPFRAVRASRRRGGKRPSRAVVVRGDHDLAHACPSAVAAPYAVEGGDDVLHGERGGLGDRRDGRLRRDCDGDRHGNRLRIRLGVRERPRTLVRIVVPVIPAASKTAASVHAPASPPAAADEDVPSTASDEVVGDTAVEAAASGGSASDASAADANRARASESTATASAATNAAATTAAATTAATLEEFSAATGGIRSGLRVGLRVKRINEDCYLLKHG